MQPVHLARGRPFDDKGQIQGKEQQGQADPLRGQEPKPAPCCPAQRPLSVGGVFDDFLLTV